MRPGLRLALSHSQQIWSISVDAWKVFHHRQRIYGRNFVKPPLRFGMLPGQRS